MVIEQIKAQLARLIPIHSVRDLTENDVTIERELALVKIINSGEERIEALRLAGAPVQELHTMHGARRLQQEFGGSPRRRSRGFLQS